MKEACASNKSLSTLGDVFKAIGEGAKHVPYRNSKLTHLLAPCLGGDGKTLMLVNVAPEPESAEESMHSLQFAAKVNAVELGGGKTRAKRNVAMTEPGAAAQMSAPGRPGDPNKSRRQSVMPLGARAARAPRRASMAARRAASTRRSARESATAQYAAAASGGGAARAPPKSTLDRDRFGVRR